MARGDDHLGKNIAKVNAKNLFFFLKNIGNCWLPKWILEVV